MEKEYRVAGSNRTEVKPVMREIPIMGRKKGIQMLWGLEIVEIEHNLRKEDLGQYSSITIEIENENPWIIQGDIRDYTKNTILVDISNTIKI